MIANRTPSSRTVWGMARQRTHVTFQAGILLFVVLGASCLFARQAIPFDNETGLRAPGIVHVAKDTLKTFGAQRAAPDDTGAPFADVTAPLAAAALLLVGSAAVASATFSRRRRLITVPSRAPPGVPDFD